MTQEIQTRKAGSFVIVDNGACRYMGVLKEVFTDEKGYLCCRLYAAVPCGRVETIGYGNGHRYPYQMSTIFIGRIDKIYKLTKKDFYEEYLNKCVEISKYNENAAYPSDY